MSERKVGDLQVWWIPQVPMKAFEVDVESLEQAALLMRVLADYDDFQFKHRVKPDYSSAGGLRRWCRDFDGEGNEGWEDWYDEESGDEFEEYWLNKTGEKIP